jgi:hypothetical protein
MYHQWRDKQIRDVNTKVVDIKDLNYYDIKIYIRGQLTALERKRIEDICDNGEHNIFYELLQTTSYGY